jgi:hypothetical protein
MHEHDMDMSVCVLVSVYGLDTLSPNMWNVYERSLSYDSKLT